MSEKQAKKNRVKIELPAEAEGWKRSEKRRHMFGKNWKEEEELKEQEGTSISLKMPN